MALNVDGYSDYARHRTEQLQTRIATVKAQAQERNLTDVFVLVDVVEKRLQQAADATNHDRLEEAQEHLERAEHWLQLADEQIAQHDAEVKGSASSNQPE
jgi:molecular chaperone DnaK (HSP70)